MSGAEILEIAEHVLFGVCFLVTAAFFFFFAWVMQPFRKSSW